MSELKAKISELLTSNNLALHGFCPFDSVAEYLLPCRAAERLKAVFSPDLPPKTVIAALFPYRRDDTKSNLSRYARVPDYHVAAGKVLEQASERLSDTFPDYQFLPFMDNSPIPEVKAASLAGLGCIGENGLLIHPDYGSWVFIGTITTDLPVSLSEPSITHCPRCGRCAAACPGHCLGDFPSRETCVSRLSQKKGILTAEEERLLRESGMAWGCDACQEACPLNKNAQIYPHPCFAREYTLSLTKESLADLTDKAYGWRGRAVPERNLSLIDGNWEKQYNK